jgi:hypothetical protein
MLRMFVSALFLCLVFALCLAIPVRAQATEELYQQKSAQLRPKDAEGHYQLGLWCLENGLPDKAKAEFTKVIGLNPNHTDARKQLGHVKHKEKWRTPDEMRALGMVFHEDKWIPYDDMMKALGRVKFENQWVTTDERDFALQLCKMYPWKGVIDKPGADSEKLPWEKAREKETEHYIVRTNLSADALNDICFLMEYAWFILQDFLKFPVSDEKPTVSVTKNRAEFETLFKEFTGRQPAASCGGTTAYRGDSANTTRKDQILSHYLAGSSNYGVLVHEATHFAVALISREIRMHPPLWLNEGLSTYFESSKVSGKKLVTGMVFPMSLGQIREVLGNNTYNKLSDHVNVSRSEHMKNANVCYAEEWSMVYFFMNGLGEKYRAGFLSYIDAWRGRKIDVKIVNGDILVQDKAAHIKTFEQCLGTSMDSLEQEWKGYISRLPAK